MKGAAQLIAGTALLAACGGPSGVVPTATSTASPEEATPAGVTPVASPTPTPVQTDELGGPVTPSEAVFSYNNFYEFSLGKGGIAELAEDFVTSPWAVTVGGLVANPRTFDLDDLRAFEAEERIYRMRCVEAWSMVIPWLGFPLARLLAEVEPTSQARYVRFETALDEAAMPGLGQPFPWPYVEGLRLDEAMHDLTILATGLYGQALPAQNGAPVRLVVPWKYGFKSLKSIVKIDLVADMPATFWATTGPTEYGFWANVNPNVPHPRWSQATEMVIGENRRKETLFFNGYADEVADLYGELNVLELYR